MEHKPINVEEIRPALRQFALLMEARLRANDYREGWRGLGTLQILAGLQASLADLLRQLAPATAAANTAAAPAQREAIAVEAANIANWAMFIADQWGGLDAEHDGRGR